MLNDQLEEDINISMGGDFLRGRLVVPSKAEGLIIIPRIDSNGKNHPFDTFLADKLQERDFATLLFHTLSAEEQADGSAGLNLELLKDRLINLVEWLQNRSELSNLPIGFLGESTLVTATLEATAALGQKIKAVVSIGGRPELAAHVLPLIAAPTLLMMGSFDYEVLSANEQAFSLLRCEKELILVEDSEHLLDEFGKTEQITEHIKTWFRKHLAANQ